MSKNLKKLVKVVNIDGKNLHIFWKTGGISINFSEKMWKAIYLLSRRSVSKKTTAFLGLRSSNKHVALQNDPLRLHMEKYKATVPKN